MTHRDNTTARYLGVDGGGSKTLAIVVDAQGCELGRGQSGGANYADLGLTRAVQHIHAAIEQAVQAAGCRLPVSRAWLGLAGLDRPEDHHTLLPHLQSLATYVHLTNDADLVLSALPDTIGIALIAGTGSIALGRDATGAVKRAGGWGHIIGDEGSGYDIGRRGLQAASKAADRRGPQTILLPLILQHWNLSRPEQIIGRVYAQQEKATIAQLAICVFRAALQEDLVASQIVRQAAQELALTVQAVGEQLSFPAHLPLALAGGLLTGEEGYREQVLQAIRSYRAIDPVMIVEQPALSAARAIINL